MNASPPSADFVASYIADMIGTAELTAESFTSLAVDVATDVAAGIIPRQKSIDCLRDRAEAAGLAESRGVDWIQKILSLTFGQIAPAQKDEARPQDDARPLSINEQAAIEVRAERALSERALSAPRAGLVQSDLDEAEQSDRAPLKIVSPTSLCGKPIPVREWIVRNWLPCGVVTGLYGDGGLGKTLLAQQLQTATARGLGWLGLPVEQVTSLGVYCEDSGDELWRRQAEINAGFGVDYDALNDVHWIPRLGEDNLLMTFARNGAGELTKFHSEVLSAALDLRARLTVFDTAADVFGGNENDRNHVRQFVSRALGSIAQRTNGAVLLCAHPSRTGLSSGEGDGGSTGWSNSLRSRLFLRAPSVEAGEVSDPNARVLQRRKANYAARNDELRLRWQNGVIEPEPPIASLATPFGRLEARDVFMGLLDDFTTNKRPVSEASRASNYAPRLFAKQPREQRQDYREVDFARAMEALFASRKIENVDYGRPSDMRRMIVRARAEQ